MRSSWTYWLAFSHLSLSVYMCVSFMMRRSAKLHSRKSNERNSTKLVSKEGIILATLLSHWILHFPTVNIANVLSGIVRQLHVNNFPLQVKIFCIRTLVSIKYTKISPHECAKCMQINSVHELEMIAYSFEKHIYQNLRDYNWWIFFQRELTR